MDYWQKLREKQEEELHKSANESIRKLNPQEGQWVSLHGQYPTVFHKIKTVSHNSFLLKIYDFCNQFKKLEIDLKFYYQVRNIEKELPDNATIWYDEDGRHDKILNI